MSPDCKVVRVESTHPESQGLFVEINATDFDPEKYTLYIEQPAPAPVIPPPVVS